MAGGRKKQWFYDDEVGDHYVLISADLTNDPLWWSLPPGEAIRKIEAAMDGEENEFSKYVRHPETWQ